MAQLRRSAAGAAATSRGWRGCGFPAMARLRIGLRRERGCDSDFGESAAAIRTSARARLRFGLRRERGCDSAAGPGWRAPPALAALRCAAGCPRRRTSRGRRRKLGAARLKHASPCFPRDALRLGAREVGVRHPGPAALRGGMAERLGLGLGVVVGEVRDRDGFGAGSCFGWAGAC